MPFPDTSPSATTTRCVGDSQHLVEIAADLTGRLDDGVDVEAGSFRGGRQIGGQDAHLDLAGDPEVPGHRFANRVGVGLGLEQRPDSRLDLQHLERFGQVIVAAHLEALCLVLDVLERAEEHHRQFARRLAGAQLPAHLIAVETRHHDVEQHEVGRVLLDAAKRGGAVEGDAQLVLAPQRLDQDVDIGLDVVDDENAAVGEVLHGGAVVQNVVQRIGRPTSMRPRIMKQADL